MKNILLLFAIVLTNYCTYGQQDTIVYYKNHAPITSSNGADQQIIIQQKNSKSSIMMTCSIKDGKWKIDKTEIIKFKKGNRYQISDGEHQITRCFKEVNGGYKVEEFNNKGEIRYKGLSKSKFPFHRVGQWQNLYNNKVVGIDVYKDELMTQSYITTNKKHLPTNSYANADSIATYQGGEKRYAQELNANIEYPRICQENGITGRVLVLFAINESGKPSNIQILKGTDHYLNQAAINAVKSCRNWKPALKNNKPIKVYQIAPIDFQLR